MPPPGRLAMKKHLIAIVSFLACWIMGSTITAANQQARYYAGKSGDRQLGANILLKGTPDEINRFSHWLDRIAEVPQGYRTLKEISESGHELIIQHARYALISAGRAQGPLSADLINGKGADVSILFNAHIPDSGSHRVYNAQRELIEYTAVENLYHELAHAMHMMKGTWRYFASERQAIEEENVFRRDLARMQGKPATERVETTLPAQEAYSTGVDVRLRR
jgi:hypothetical protein